jgi:hypothetical protein
LVNHGGVGRKWFLTPFLGPEEAGSMATRREQWLLAAGILLCVAAEPASSPPVMVTTGVITIPQAAAPGNDATAAPGAVRPAKSKPRNAAASTYNPVPRDAFWRAADLPPAPKKAVAAPPTQTIRVSEPALPAVEASPPCEVRGGYVSSETRTGSSYWERCRAHLQDCFLGYPGEFSAPPLGQFLYQHGTTEVANGTAARMTLYHYDFVEGRNALNQRGKDQLAKIAALLPHNFFPVVVERTPEAPALAEARRLLVLNELGRSSFPIPPERVMVAVPMANGISGVEAEKIYRNLIGQTAAGGMSLPPIGGQATQGTGSSTGLLNLNVTAGAAAGAGAGATAPSP